MTKIPYQKYKFISSISVRNGKKNYRIQLANASDFGGVDYEYRVYLNRKWLDGFYNEIGLLQLINSLCFDDVTNTPPFQKGARIKLYSTRGKHVFENTFVKDNCIQSAQGEWLVPCCGHRGYISEKLIEKL